MEDRTALLARVPLFTGLERDALARVAQLVEEVEVPAGTELTNEGRYEGYFYVVVAGSVRIDRGGATVDEIGPGGHLGEISLIDDGPRTATAVAVTPCLLLRLTNREFDAVLDDNPALRESLEASMSSRLERIDEEAAAR